MKDLNKFLKIIYQQNAGELQLDILSRQYNKINSEIEYLSNVIKSKKIIKNPKNYNQFSNELALLTEQYVTLDRDPSKSRREKREGLNIISNKRKAITQEPLYLSSFEKLNKENTEEIMTRISKLEVEKDKIYLKILLKKSDIKNQKDFLRYYENIEYEILNNFNNYIIKNIKKNKIKNKTHLKETIVLLKKLIKLKGFSPLFEDNEEIKDIFNEGKILMPFNKLESKILEIETLIKKHFEPKDQEPQTDEITKNNVNTAVSLLSVFTFRRNQISLKDFPDNFVKVINNNTINYSIQDFISEFVVKPFEKILNETESNIITILNLIKKNPRDIESILLPFKHDDLYIDFFDLIYYEESDRIKQANQYLSDIRNGTYKHNLNNYYDHEISNLFDSELTKAELLNLNKIINTLKIIFFYNYQYLIEDTELDGSSFLSDQNNIHDIFNHLKIFLKFDFETEIEFMNDKIMSVLGGNADNKITINNIYFLFKFVIKYDLSLNDHYKFIINYNIPLNDEELEDFINDFREEINDPRTSKFYTNLYTDLNESTLIYSLPPGVEKPDRNQINKILKYKYYLKNKLLSYEDRKVKFISYLKNLFQNGLGLIPKFEGRYFITHKYDNRELYNSIQINYFSRPVRFPQLKLEKLNKINLALGLKQSDIQNIASNLEDRDNAIVFDGIDIEIFQIRNLSESMRIGKNTAWCTAASSDNYFCQYHKPKLNNLFIIQPKGDKRSDIYCTKTLQGQIVLDQNGNPKKVKSFLKYQLDTVGKDLMDPCDEPVNICNLIKEYPELKYFLRFITYYEYDCRELKRNELVEEPTLDHVHQSEANLGARKLRLIQREARRRRRQRRRAAAVNKP